MSTHSTDTESASQHGADLESPTATRTGDVEPLLKLLDALDELPAAIALRDESYELLQLAAGERAVDVGSGSGRAVAELVERSVVAVGVDPDEAMLATARQRYPRADFRAAGAYDLPFATGELAGYRADKVLHVLDDPSRALDEAHRVLRPGGRVVLVGQDWDSFIIDADDPVLIRCIVQARAATVASPRAARCYRNLLLDAGFSDVTVGARTAVFTSELMLPMLTGIAEAAYASGAIDGDQAQQWITEQQTRAQRDRLFVAIPLFLAHARRP
ncbi:MAG TPA: methyltransferase domain-containing protein [Segeticoccus sp.]|nr:methyltransferase domain-containing protein [Segeticoccus sp.]